MDDQFGVREGSKDPPSFLEVFTQLDIVVKLAIDNSVNIAFQAVKGLSTSFDIDDGQTSVAKT